MVKTLAIKVSCDQGRQVEMILPVNVANVEDLTVSAHHSTNLGVASDILNNDGREPKIGGHGKVGDGGDQGNGRGDVVEYAVSTRLGEG